MSVTTVAAGAGARGRSGSPGRGFCHRQLERVEGVFERFAERPPLPFRDHRQALDRHRPGLDLDDDLNIAVARCRSGTGGSGAGSPAPRMPVDARRMPFGPTRPECAQAPRAAAPGGLTSLSPARSPRAFPADPSTTCRHCHPGFGCAAGGRMVTPRLDPSARGRVSLLHFPPLRHRDPSRCWRPRAAASRTRSS